MNIRSLFSSGRPQKKDYYAAVSLREKDGELRILEIDEGRHSVRALVRKSFGYTNGWINIVEDIDEVLYLCERETGFEARSILFILYSHLIDQDSKTIKKQYYDCIKETVRQLDLKTVGYMEYHEAVSRFFGDQERFPLHALVVEVDHPSIMTFLYQDGSVLASECIERSNQCAADLEVSLQKISLQAILPSRIILYESPSLVADSTPIVTHEWPTDLFPQQPKIDVLKPSELEDALIHGISWQLFSADSTVVSPDKAVVAVPTDGLYPPNELDEDPVTSPPAATAEEIQDEPLVTQNGQEKNDADISELGFVQGGEIRETVSVQSKINTDSDTTDFPRVTDRTHGMMDRVKGLLSMVAIPKLHVPVPSMGKARIAIGIFIVLCLLSSGIVALLYRFHTVTLSLVFALPKIEETVQLESPLPVVKKEKDVSAHVTIVTTGTKEVGDKAKGSVTIYNAEAKVQSFTKGTTIRSGSQEFLLDKDVKVASASEQLTSGGDVLTVTGKETTSVTAKDIGEEFNLKKDTKFTVGSLSQSSVFAVASNAFAGGSKKKVQAASKEDVAKLRSEADTHLKDELAKLVQSDESVGIVDSLTELSKGEEKFSTDLDKEAKSIDLTKTATATYYEYDKTKTAEIVRSSLKKSMGSKYDVTKSKITFKIESAELDGDAVTADLATTISPVPVIDENKIKQDIRGMSLSDLDRYIERTIKATEITVRPDHPLPILNDRIPFFTKNIEIVVEVK